MREYTVVFEKSGTGWCAYYPDLPGLASCGASLEETRSLTQEGLNLHLEAMMDSDDPIPAPRHLGAQMLFEVPDFVQEESVLEARAA